MSWRTRPVLALLLALTAAAAQPQPAPFRAHYQVYAKGIQVGVGSIVLERKAAGPDYAMRAELSAVGLAKLLFSDRVEERVSGVFANQGPQPQRYSYRRRGGDRDQSIRLVFDYPAAEIRVERDGRETLRMTLAPRTVDPLSLYAQVMWDLARGGPAAEYRVIDRGEPRVYRVRDGGSATLDTGVGRLDTRRFTRSRPGSRRVTTLWLSPALDHLPAQIAQHKDGRETLRMTLQRVER